MVSMSVKRIIFYIALLCGSAHGLSAQDTSRLFVVDGMNAFAYPNIGPDFFPAVDLYTGGVCEQYAGACSALVDGATFFERNPAASSLIYDAPHINLAHRNYFLNSSTQTVGIAHAIQQFGFGFGFRYTYSAISAYDVNEVYQGVFSPTEILFGVNFSYNLLRVPPIDGISVGINIKGALDVIPVRSTTMVDAGAVFTDIGVLLTLHALKIIDFPRPNMGIALTYRNAGAVLTGETIPAPGALAFGFSYAPVQQLMVTTDVEFTLSDLSNADILDITRFSAGIGIFPIDIIEVGAGFHINSSQYFFTAGLSVTIRGIQIRFIQTFDILTSFEELDNFSISVALKAQGAVAPDKRLSVQKLYLQSLEAFLDEDFDVAISFINNALLISPNYQPAIDLKKQISALQAVNELLN